MTRKKGESTLTRLINENRKDLLSDWVREQLAGPAARPDLITNAELDRQSSDFLHHFVQALDTGGDLNSDAPAWSALREALGSYSRSRAQQGFSPSETATFVLSFKQPLFTLLQQNVGLTAAEQVTELWTANVLLDQLALYTTEVYQRSREEVIRRQQAELLELSTPVVKIWDGILAVPLIGTLDSARTQTVMENLLQKIVETGASVAIIDITGVPTVDTLVAQHLIKTVAAARLMGADCLISGVRAQIAQTIVHLGISLENISTKATLADAIALALKQSGLTIARAPRVKV